MLNIFKPKYTVQQIHDEIDSAQERLLQEAKAILSNKTDINTIAHELGFINTPSAKRGFLKEKTIKDADKKASLIEYYKQNYPFQKFLTEEELNRICKKYKLVYAPIQQYIKDVPVENLLEIKNTKRLFNSDEAEDKIYCKLTLYASIFPSFFGFISIYNKCLYKLPRIMEDEYFKYISNADEFIKSKYNIDIDFIVKKVKNVTIHRSGLFIAAPKSHFDLKNKESVGQFGYFNFTITEVKDPIVFRYCKGGVQILSKWGLEASDEALVNEINN